MNHTLGMRRRQSFGKLNSQSNNFILRQCSRFQLITERCPMNQFHGEKIHIAMAVKIENGGNVGMIEFR